MAVETTSGTGLYFAAVRDLIARIEAEQMGAIEKAADVIAGAVANGGVVHLFGTGHSHMLGEEVFYRAGGLVPVNTIFEPSLMLHDGPAKSSRLERLSGFARCILDETSTKSGEPIIIISNSGINAVPVEMALEAKTRDLVVIALTSVAASMTLPPRHSSGKRLYELADIVLDNYVPHGDALVQPKGVPQKTGAASTIAGAIILNAVMVRAIEKLAGEGGEVPVFMSSNVPGGTEHNARLLGRFRERIRRL